MGMRCPSHLRGALPGRLLGVLLAAAILVGGCGGGGKQWNGLWIPAEAQVSKQDPGGIEFTLPADYPERVYDAFAKRWDKQGVACPDRNFRREGSLGAYFICSRKDDRRNSAIYVGYEIGLRDWRGGRDDGPHRRLEPVAARGGDGRHGGLVPERGPIALRPRSGSAPGNRG